MVVFIFVIKSRSEKFFFWVLNLSAPRRDPPIKSRSPCYGQRGPHLPKERKKNNSSESDKRPGRYLQYGIFLAFLFILQSHRPCLGTWTAQGQFWNARHSEPKEETLLCVFFFDHHVCLTMPYYPCYWHWDISEVPTRTPRLWRLLLSSIYSWQKRLPPLNVRGQNHGDLLSTMFSKRIA